MALKAADLVNLFEIVKTTQLNPTTGLLHRVRINKKEICRFYTTPNEPNLYCYKILGTTKRIVRSSQEEAIFEMAKELEKYYDDVSIDDVVEQISAIDPNYKHEKLFEARSYKKLLEVFLKKFTFSYLNNKCTVIVSKEFEKGYKPRMKNFLIYKIGKKKETLQVETDTIKATIKLKIFGNITGVFD